MKRALIIAALFSIAFFALIAFYFNYQQITLVDRILDIDTETEISERMYARLSTKLTAPGAISNDQFEDLIIYALQRTLHEDEWLFSLLVVSSENNPHRSLIVRDNALEFINTGKDTTGNVLGIIDISQAPVKPHELDLKYLFSSAGEALIVSIYLAIQEELVIDGKSLYHILEERDVVSDKVLGLYKILFEAK